VKEWILPALTGFATGILSAWGIGGGTLLLLVMTLFLGVDDAIARTVNLLYFLPSAGMSLPSHYKNGLLCKSVILPAALWGSAAAILGTLLGQWLDVSLLRKFFGGYLLCVAVSMIADDFRQSKKG